MDKVFPDKWVRKALYDALNNIVVEGSPIQVFDVRVTGPSIPLDYIVMSTQTNTVDKDNKCEWFWNHTTLLDVATTFKLPGNPGSRLEVDEIMDSVRAIINTLTLDVASGLSIITKTQSYPNDITTVTKNEIVSRKFLRLELLIK